MYNYVINTTSVSMTNEDTMKKESNPNEDSQIHIAYYIYLIYFPYHEGAHHRR